MEVYMVKDYERIAAYLKTIANPTRLQIIELLQKYQSTDGLQQAMSILSDVMMKVTKTERGLISELEEKQVKIQRVVGLLMSYQIIFPGYFGDDDEFVDLAIKLFYEILKS